MLNFVSELSKIYGAFAEIALNHSKKLGKLSEHFEYSIENQKRGFAEIFCKTSAFFKACIFFFYSRLEKSKLVSTE